MRPSPPMKRVITPSRRAVISGKSIYLLFSPSLLNSPFASTYDIFRDVCIVFPQRVPIRARMADFSRFFSSVEPLLHEKFQYLCAWEGKTARTVGATRYHSASEWADKIISQQQRSRDFSSLRSFLPSFLPSSLLSTEIRSDIHTSDFPPLLRDRNEFNLYI